MNNTRIAFQNMNRNSKQRLRAGLVVALSVALFGQATRASLAADAAPTSPASAPNAPRAVNPPNASASRTNASAAKPSYETTGAQVGEQLPDLTLRTTGDEPKQLSDAWNSGPAILLASSFTCPKSRSKWPEAKAIAEKYGKQLNVVIIYVIEAHPKGDVCPYKGVEDVTEENVRDGILRHQPKTMKDRLALVKEFVDYLRVDATIYVDTMDNQAWKALGSGPNMAALVMPGGIVAARQGWFDGPALEKPILAALNKWRKEIADEQKIDRWRGDHESDDEKLKAIGESEWTLYGLANKDQTAKSIAFLKAHPEYIKAVVPYDPRGNEGGRTQLMFAAGNGNVEFAQWLLENGADVNARTVQVPSALHEAANAGNLKMVDLLLEHHADVNQKAWRGSVTPLREAVIFEHPQVVQALLKRGAKEDFFTDIGLGKLDAVRTALKADPSRASRPDGWSRMPLDYAAATGQVEVANLLLENGAPPGGDDSRETELPIHWATRYRHAAMVELLLNAGATPDARLYREGTPLHIAAELGAADVARVLIAHHANLKTRDMLTYTPLHIAAKHGNAEIIAAARSKPGPT